MKTRTVHHSLLDAARVSVREASKLLADAGIEGGDRLRVLSRLDELHRLAREVSKGNTFPKACEIVGLPRSTAARRLRRMQEAGVLGLVDRYANCGRPPATVSHTTAMHVELALGGVILAEALRRTAFVRTGCNDAGVVRISRKIWGVSLASLAWAVAEKCMRPFRDMEGLNGSDVPKDLARALRGPKSEALRRYIEGHAERLRADPIYRL